MVIVRVATEFYDRCKKTKFISVRGIPIARISGARDMFCSRKNFIEGLERWK